MLTGYILWTYSVCIRYLVLAYHGQSAAGCVFFLQSQNQTKGIQEILCGIMNALVPAC